MNKKIFEECLMSKKLRQCAKNDLYIKNMLGKDNEEEFGYYSDTSRVMKELTDKYHFTPKEIFEFKRTYEIYFEQESFKDNNK